jgi:hypothetical protein
MKKQNESKNGEEVKLGKIGKIIDKAIKKAIINHKRLEREQFASTLAPMMKDMDEVMEKIEKEHTNLRLENFRYKMAFITFNGILLALMVGSSDKIDYGLFTYVFLFVSFVFGILHFVAYYFWNMFEYIKEKSLADKCKIVFRFCKTHMQDENAINDTKSFLRNVIATEFGDQERLNSIPLLLKNFNKKK